MKVDHWQLLTECIERGLLFGWNRAHKHTDTPDQETVLEHQQREIESCICQYYSFSDSATSEER